MTSSWLNWCFEYDKILKILSFKNFGKILQFWRNFGKILEKILHFWEIFSLGSKFWTFLEKISKFCQMPRQMQCTDAQANEMPRWPARCPGKRDAQMPSYMPRCHTRCLDDQRDAQANEMPRCPAICPDVTRDAQVSHEMPRCHTRCPDVTQDAQMSHKMPRCQISLGIWANWHLGILSLGIWANWHLGILSLAYRCPGKRDAQMTSEMPR